MDALLKAFSALPACSVPALLNELAEVTRQLRDVADAQPPLIHLTLGSGATFTGRVLATRQDPSGQRWVLVNPAEFDGGGPKDALVSLNVDHIAAVTLEHASRNQEVVRRGGATPAGSTASSDTGQTRQPVTPPASAPVQEDSGLPSTVSFGRAPTRLELRRRLAATSETLSSLAESAILLEGALESLPNQDGAHRLFLKGLDEAFGALASLLERDELGYQAVRSSLRRVTLQHAEARAFELQDGVLTLSMVLTGGDEGLYTSAELREELEQRL